MRSESKLLFDIADASRLIADFLQGVDRVAFDQDLKTQAAILHELPVIGEAVKNLPDTWREQHPSIPWGLIGRMRDHLIHRYFSVDTNIIWDAATSDVPALLRYITPFVTTLLHTETSDREPQ